VKTKLEDLRKWFGKGKKGDWVRVGTDGEIKGDCAREPGEGKPKCMPRDKAHSMSKKDRGASARRKRRADPDVDRPGTGNKPIMVKTDKKKNESVELDENKLKAGDKVKTPQGTVEIKTRDTAGMRGKQDKFSMILHMKNGKKVSMGSHPSPSADAVKNIAKRFDKGVPSYMAHLNKESVQFDEKRDAGKSATGYDIYHKTYSGAMQHAYAHAKKKHGVTVSSDDIDSKVASGPSKPSSGKTVSHVLGTDKKKKLHVQVYNIRM
jgi:hypothetical protein